MCRLRFQMLIAPALLYSVAVDAKPNVTGQSPATATPAAALQPPPPVELPFVPYRNFLETRCYLEPNHDRADLCAQWRAALAAEAAASSSRRANTIAIVSSILSLFGIIGLLITLWLTRTANTLSRRAAEAAERTAQDSQKIGEAQARCYLSIEAVRAYISEEDGRPHLLISIRNSGASPALETSWTATIGYALTGSATARWDVPRPPDLIRAAIAPGRVFEVPAVDLDFPIDPVERAHLLKNGEWLQLSARLSVTASDVFEKSVETEDYFTGSIHDLDVWFALEATGAQPIRTVSSGIVAS